VGSNSEYVYLLEAIIITPEKLTESINRHLDLYQVLGIIYLTGVGIFSLRFIFQLIQIGLLIHRYGISRKEGFNFVITNPHFTPFSFFNIIFLGNDIADQGLLEKIITHEKIHIQQKHSVDIILLEILTIVQWFNPFMWFYKSTLKNIHEFLADEGVLTEGINKIDYQELLVYQSIGIQLIGISNNFSQSLIKRRLIMMSKSKSQKFKLLKMAFILPLALFLTIVFSSIVTERVVAQTDKNEIKTAIISNDQKPQEEEVYTVVEKMPQYPGGDEARIKFLRENIKYPEEARKNGISGMVFVSFVVEKDGKITDVKLLRGVHELLDEEALRVVRIMPAWNPGIQRGKPVRVQYNLPIQFNLDKGAKKVKDGEQKDPPPPPPPPNQEK
jgi:TonB family protein